MFFLRLAVVVFTDVLGLFVIKAKAVSCEPFYTVNWAKLVLLIGPICYASTDRD